DDDDKDQPPTDENKNPPPTDDDDDKDQPPTDDDKNPPPTDDDDDKDQPPSGDNENPPPTDDDENPPPPDDNENPPPTDDDENPPPTDDDDDKDQPPSTDEDENPPPTEDDENTPTSPDDDTNTPRPAGTPSPGTDRSSPSPPSVSPNPTSTNCFDRINPKTRVSDCPMLKYLCNDQVYYALMTEQCPKTCNRCTDDVVLPNPDCFDRINPKTGVSDCPQLQYLCNNQQYFALMTEQCPKTCSRCCVDRVNPRTGVSDCLRLKYLCTDKLYLALMTEQCPKTCNRCTDAVGQKPFAVRTQLPNVNIASTSTSAPLNPNSGCVDRVNPKTGVSDCPRRIHLCNDPLYRSLMTEQCPRTCNGCSDAVGQSPAPPAAAVSLSGKPKKPPTKETPLPNANIASTAPTSSNSNCVDRVNPKTGVSDCLRRLHLCNDPVYRSLMTEHCPRACNRCTGAVKQHERRPTIAPTSATAHPTAAPPMPAANNCVDHINRRTGVLDCPRKAALCRDPRYLTVMQQQCPRTCGFCS
ncbi:shTK domain protein, partial [Ancylostoma duodenale]